MTNVWANFEKESAESASPRGCKIGRLLRSMSADDRTTVQRVLDNPEVTHRWLHRAFKERDFTAGPETIRMHRAGQCTCERVAE